MKTANTVNESAKEQLDEKANLKLDRKLYNRLKRYIATPNYYTPAFQAGFEKVVQKLFPSTY